MPESTGRGVEVVAGGSAALEDSIRGSRKIGGRNRGRIVESDIGNVVMGNGRSK